MFRQKRGKVWKKETSCGSDSGDGELIGSNKEERNDRGGGVRQVTNRESTKVWKGRSSKAEGLRVKAIGNLLGKIGRKGKEETTMARGMGEEAGGIRPVTCNGIQRRKNYNKRKEEPYLGRKERKDRLSFKKEVQFAESGKGGQKTGLVPNKLGKEQRKKQNQPRTLETNIRKKILK